MGNSILSNDFFEQVPASTGHELAILVSDPAARRLIEGIATQLELTVSVLHPSVLNPSALDRSAVSPWIVPSPELFRFELIVADEPIARELRRVFERQADAGKLVRPALVALRDATSDRVPRNEHEFDAVLTLADKPATLSAQLGVALYSYRAFTRRYQSALDELSLNRDIFKSVTSGISVANAQLPDLPLMYVNPAFEVMTGYSLEEIQGKNCRFLQGEERDQPGLTIIREAIAQKREAIALIRNYRKDGSPFWNELALSPIRNQHGDLTHFVGIQMDVTERVEFEMALRESEKLAAVGRLASAIAHEINNPLEAVMNLVYLAQQALPKGSAPTDADHYLGLADLELRRIKLIAAQSLRFCKQSSAPEAVTSQDLLSSLLHIYGKRLVNFGIALERRDRSRRSVVCLASEIRQVISNLISNALDAMRQNGGRLLIRTRDATNWKTMRRGLLITVADTGHGISDKTRANMFKAFYTTKGEAGTGLGLWISSEIMERHHGTLRARSKGAGANTGTVFQLFLPEIQGAPAA